MPTDPLDTAGTLRQHVPNCPQNVLAGPHILGDCVQHCSCWREREAAILAALDASECRIQELNDISNAQGDTLEIRARQVAKLRAALTDVLNMIEIDELIPESVSYMRNARAVLTDTEPQSVSQPKEQPANEYAGVSPPLDLKALWTEACKDRFRNLVPSDVRQIIALLRETRAALESLLQDSPSYSREDLAEYWADLRDQAIAVLAKARDE